MNCPNKKRLRRTMMFLNAQKPSLIKDPYIYKPPYLYSLQACFIIRITIDTPVSEFHHKVMIS